MLRVCVRLRLFWFLVCFFLVPDVVVVVGLLLSMAVLELEGGSLRADVHAW